MGRPTGSSGPPTPSPSRADVTFHYRDYVLRADKVTYNRKTTNLQADGHLQVTGGPNDVLINATHGDMQLDMHTARFYNVSGSQGMRTAGHTVIYTTHQSTAVFRARGDPEQAKAAIGSLMAQ